MASPFSAEENRQPMLERALPGDVGESKMILENTEAEVQLRDGSWVYCRVTGQRKDGYGRWCVQIRYFVSSSFGEGGVCLLDRRYIRRIPHEDDR